MSDSEMSALYHGKRPPTPEEIAAIATALGCPVERLTVSREELEEERDSLWAHLRHEQCLRREDIQGKIAYRKERDALRARVAELEARIEEGGTCYPTDATPV